MKHVLAVMLGLGILAASDPVCAGLLTYPKRLVGSRTVDLTPLFQWWKQQRGPRPLTAWLHVTGTIVETNSFGWIVDAQIGESSPRKGEKRREQARPATRERIVLKSPPLADLAQFEVLKNQRKASEAERTRLKGEAERAEKRAREISNRRDRNRLFRKRSRGRAQESRLWKQTENDAKAGMKLLDAKIRDADAKLADYPSQNKFTVDCFALRTDQRLNGLPVYDHGVAIRSD